MSSNQLDSKEKDMSYAIRVKNLSKRYRVRKKNNFLLTELFHLAKSKITGASNPLENYFWALQGVDFQVEKGKSLGVVGPNGAGKSTLLKLLANVTSPTQGQIDINGKVSCLIEVGAGFHPELTGRENVYLNASVLGLKKKDIERKMDDIVEFAEIEEFMDIPIKRYSSGMKVRLGFSVAIHVEPEILLVDEVLSVGDASFRAKCTEKIQELRRAGTTILLVSHNNLTVSNNCDKAIYLEHGKIKQFGDTRDVLDSYEKDIEEIDKKRLQKEVEKNRKAENRENERVKIVAFDLMDSAGQIKSEFNTGEEMVLRIAYRAKKELANPGFGIGLMRYDGLACFGTRTYFSGISLGTVFGDNEIRLVIEKLNLLKGAYQVSIGVWENHGKYQIYMDLNIAQFRVVPKKRNSGAFYLDHHWQE